MQCAVGHNVAGLRRKTASGNERHSKPSAEGIIGRGTGSRKGNAIGTNTGNGGGSNRYSSSRPQEQRQQLNPRKRQQQRQQTSATAAAAADLSTSGSSSGSSANDPALSSFCSAMYHRRSRDAMPETLSAELAQTATAALHLRRPQLRPSACVCADRNCGPACTPLRLPPVIMRARMGLPRC